MIVGGLVAGQGQISLLALIAIVWACCLLGDAVSYEIGQRKGRAWLLKYGGAAADHREPARPGREAAHEPRRGDDHRRALPRVRAPADARSSPAPRGCRSGASSRTTCSPRARGRSSFCTLGFLFWRSIDKLTTYVSRGLFALGTLVVVIAGIVALIHLRRSPRRARRSATGSTSATTGPGWSVLARISRPVWHFVLQARPRRSPTSTRPLQLRAAHARQPRPGADDAARARRRRDVLVLPARRHRPQRGRAADRPLGARTSPTRLNMDMLVSLAKVVTHLGSSPVTGGARRGHRDLRGRPPAPDRGRLAGGGLADRVRARAHHQDRVRPRPPARGPRRDDQPGVSRRAIPRTP